MSIDRETYQKIRQLSEGEGKSQRQIADELILSRNTVRKYADGSAVPWVRKEGTGKTGVITDAYHNFIMACLKEDKIENLSKQYHTARRIYHRLCDEMSFTGSESTVRRRVAALRNELSKKKVFVPLSYEPGDAVQIDWGEAKSYINGERISLNYFCMRECYSGDIFGIAFFRQNKESFLEGLLAGFEYFGGVPKRVIFDNAKVAVKEGFGHCAVTQEYYADFAAHYCFKPVFCNVASGNEKGLVENLVGYFRKNILVPVPRVKDIDTLNAKFIEHCREYREKHTIESRTVPVRELILESQRAFRPLPPYRFDTSQTITTTPNDFSLVTVDRHKYSVPVKYADDNVTVKAYGNHVEIYYTSQLISSFTRLYGEASIHKPAFKLEHYMELLEMRPASVYNARPVKESIPPILYRFIKAMDDPQKIVRVLKCYIDEEEHLMELINTGASFEAIEPLLSKNGLKEKSTRRRNRADTSEAVTSHLPSEKNIKVEPVNLNSYDTLIGGNHP